MYVRIMFSNDSFFSVFVLSSWTAGIATKSLFHTQNFRKKYYNTISVLIYFSLLVPSDDPNEIRVGNKF